MLPGLGAVLAHGVAASYDGENGVWSVPRRVFSFNPALSRTDGLLAASIARREGISAEAAAAKLGRAVEDARKSLSAGESVSLGDAGSLRMDGGMMDFTPGAGRLLTPSLAWLPEISVKPLPSAIDEYNKERAREHGRRLAAALSRVARIAACIAVLVALGWIAVQNLTYAPAEQLASMAPAHSPAAIEAPAASQAPVVLVLARAPKDEVIENIPASPVVKPHDGAYCLVVASLASEAEAREFVSQYPGMSLGVLNKDGRFRVYAASAATYEEALEASKNPEITSRFSSAWVCRK